MTEYIRIPVCLLAILGAAFFSALASPLLAATSNGGAATLQLAKMKTGIGSDFDWCPKQCRGKWGMKKKKCLCECQNGDWHGTRTKGYCVYM
jgi:hypothetical protein